MPFTVEIYKKGDPIPAIDENSYGWPRDDKSASKFWWTEGNGSCDCNRGLFFHRIKHPEAEDLEENDPPCGDTEYKIRVLVEGNVVLDELNGEPF